MRRRGRRRNALAIAFVIAVFAFLFAPLVLVALFSFHSSSRMSLPFDGFSLRWYREVLGEVEVTRGIRNSAIAAVSVGVITAVLGVTAALGLLGVRSKARAAVVFFAMIPMAVPSLLFGIGLTIFYRAVGVDKSLLAAIGGQTVLALPFVFFIVNAALDRFGFSLLEAARDLGAGPFHAFRTITLPLLLPAILGAMLLAMSLSTDEFVVTFFTAGQDKTLPLVMYGRLNLKLDPSLNAIGTLLLVTTSLLAFLSARQSAKEST